MPGSALAEDQQRPAAATVVQPADAREAQRLLDAGAAHTAAIAGGTALQLGWPDGQAPPMRLVDVSRLPQAQGLRWPDGHGRPEADKGPGGIEAAANATLRIGCASTLAALARDAALRQALPLLGAALDAIGAPGVRTLATLGGNLGWRHGDGVAALLVLDASVELAQGQRQPLADWLALARLPLAVAVHVPLGQPPGWFEKVGGREAFSPSRLTLAGCGGRLAAVAGDLPGKRLQRVEQWLAHRGARPQAGADRPADSLAEHLADALAADLTHAGRVDAWRVTAATHLIRARLPA